jgi:CubicO group peptidase (beta-lactamase class C family)
LPSSKTVAANADEYLNAAHRLRHFSGSVLVARNGTPLISKGYGMANYELNVPNTPQTVFRVGSITKQFTAMAIMMLQERGKLNVADPICKFVENCPPAWQTITIRHLLTHTSGLANYTALPETRKVSVQNSTSTEIVDLFRNKPLEFKPGEKFAYSNSGYYLLGLMIDKTSGKSYAEFLRDNIFTPLGMKNSGDDASSTLVPNRASGYRWAVRTFVNAEYTDMGFPYSAGALYSTTGDLLLWDQALYTDKPISRKSLDETFTPFMDIDFMPGAKYAYGWAISKRSNRPMIEHGGDINGFSTYIRRFPAENVTVIVLSNQERYKVDKVTDDLSDIVFGEPYKMPVMAISDLLAATIEQKGIATALEQYRDLKRTQPENYDFSERLLDRFGYDLLESKKVNEAIEILKLNAEMFPQSSNVYDSLGESYMVNGDKDLAIKNYEKSLELDPKNTNAVDMLKKLRSGN